MIATDASTPPGRLAPLPPRRRELLLLGALLLYGAVLWVWGVGRLDFHGSMEGSRALVAQQMIRTGDYVVPRRGATLYLAKPPLFYWGVVLASKPWGRVTETSVRLVSALSVAGIVLLTYFGARRVLGPKTAFLAAAVGATTPFALESATEGLVDTLLALGVTLSLLGAFFLSEGGPRAWLHAVACGVGLAIGLLTKGPIVLLFFVPTVVLYAGFRREGSIARSVRSLVPYFAVVAVSIGLVPVLSRSLGTAAALLYLPPAVMLAAFVRQGRAPTGGGGARAWLVVVATTLALVVPWLVLAARDLGLDTLTEILGREIWRDRLAAPGSSNRGPIWVYATEFTVATLPYVLFVPLAFLPGYGARGDGASRRMLLFLRCWLLGGLVLFTVVGEARRLRYVFPAYPAASLLAAHVLASAAAGALERRASRYAAAAETFVVYGMVLAPVVLAVVWFRAGLELSGWTLAIASVAAAGAAVGIVLHRAGRRPWALLASVALVLLAGKMHRDFGQSRVTNERKSPRVACERLRARVPPGETLWLSGVPSASAAFYLDAPPFEDLAEDPGRLAHHDRLFVCVGEADRASFAPPPGFAIGEESAEESPAGGLHLLRLDRRQGG